MVYKYVKAFFMLNFKIQMITYLIIVFVFMDVFSKYNRMQTANLIENIHSADLKAVELVTRYFLDKNWAHKNLGEIPFKNCVEKRCYAFKSWFYSQTPNEQSDGVMVHLLNYFSMVSKTRYNRNPRQLWLLHTRESQHRSFCSTHYNIEDLDDWFNLTSTFKANSTQVTDYKLFSDWSAIQYTKEYLRAFKALTNHKLTENYLRKELETKSKTNSIVWFVSNCETYSRREEYVKELVKHIDVDVYGSCSKHYKENAKIDPCHTNESIACLVKVYSKYKFYLAFENSLCNEYITEKYWKLYSPAYIFNANIVPIVRGAHANDYSAKSMKHSFINADDFESPEKLANYLAYLNDNQTAYLEYFKWKIELFDTMNKRNYSDVKYNQFDPDSSPFCEICSKLHNETYLSQKNENIKVSKFFNPNTDCWDKHQPYGIINMVVKFFGYCI